MEPRVLLSSTITAWDFNSLTAASNTSPAPSIGSGNAASIGMALFGTGDASAILAGTGSNGGSSDGTTGNIWRVVGGNGWNSAASLGAQGAQFLAATTGYNNVGVKFDFYATTQGEANLQVEYTTDGASWVTANSLSIGVDTGISIVDNRSGADTNSVQGEYFHITGGQNWYNGLTADLTGIPGVLNNASFGIRLVNASKGAACVNTSGVALNNTSGNWRFDEVKVFGDSFVAAAPVVTTQPANQVVNPGTPVTFTSVASGNPVPAQQWQISTNGGGTWSDIPGATSGSYAFTSLEGQSGNQYRARFTSTGFAAVFSNAATLIVVGTPIAQWNWTTGMSSVPPAAQVPGTADLPLPSLSGHATDSASTLGMSNDYTGVQTFPEADVHAKQSTVNGNFTEFLWRVRAGNGTGPTGSPGSPEGWSQYAPQFSQGVQFAVNTTGFTNITLHFDWTAGGISYLQPQYTADITAATPTWLNVGTPIAGQKDYYGITPATNPTGVLVNLQGIAAANNDPTLGIRLVAAYDPALPLVNDGNLLIPGDHGQYSSVGIGPVNETQMLTFGGGIFGHVNGGTFTLTFNGQTTPAISYSADPATLATNIGTALAALSSIGGAANVSVIPYTGDSTFSRIQVTFQGSLAGTDVSELTTASSLTGSTPTVVAQTWMNGSLNGPKRYIDGSGAWEFGNFSFNGYGASGVAGVTSQPASATIVAGTTNTFTASAYSETAVTSAQWQISTDNGFSWSNIAGATNLAGASPVYTSSYTTPAEQLTDTGKQFRVSFTNASGITYAIPATLTVVAPVLPTVTVQPNSVSTLEGAKGAAFFYSQATGSPVPTVQWQQRTGSTWTDVGLATSNAFTVLAPAVNQSGTQYRAAFTNVGGTVYSNIVTLTVLPSESVITAWDFATHPTVGGDPVLQTGLWDNHPAPTTGTGTASPVGMDRGYDPLDAATGDGVTAFGSAADSDVVSQASPGITGFSENIWRVRGGVPDHLTTAGTPSNGWSNFAPEGTQGAQFSVSTVGYSHIYLNFDWYSTQSGIRDMQGQYSVDGVTFHNLGSVFEANPVEDYYGVYQTGLNGGTKRVIPVVLDTSAITGPDAALVANNPNFTFRVVSVYNPFLPQVNGHGQYANASPNNPADPTTVVPYNGSKGNWRFDHIEVHGTSILPAWLDPTSTATWDSGTHALTVTGPATIIADPGADEPVITASGAAAQLTVNTAAQLIQTPDLIVHVGGVSLTNGAGIDFLSAGAARTHDKHGVLVVGAAAAAAVPMFSVDAIHGSKLNLEDNDLIVHNGDLAAVLALAAAGRNVAAGGVADGTWNGNGLTSSKAAAADSAEGFEKTVLAVVRNGDQLLGSLSSWKVGASSEALTDSDVLVKYTYNGDFALEGMVGDNAATIFSNDFDGGSSHGHSWFDGDTNGDGVIDDSDATLFSTVFGNGSGGAAGSRL